DMIVFDNKLYVCGDFDEMGGVAANDVAYWDGSTWHAVGFSTNSSFANAFAEYNGHLYVGTFDFDSSYVYGMDLGLSGVEESQSEIKVTAFPNPVVQELKIMADHPITYIAVYTANGQLVYNASIAELNQLTLD